MAFPYVIRRDQELGKHVKGEVYEVDKETLSRLDMLEGVPTHYKRINAYVEYTDGGSENVSMYVKADGDKFEIPKGMKIIDEFKPAYTVQVV
jgi:gamma-glutamylcyclotransferase (GGCT)/AIG2-like uncharacterized protein YtfP